MTTGIDTALGDPARLADLRALRLLDSPADACYDRLVHLGKRLTSTPMCLVTLVDDARQYFKAGAGMSAAMEAKREGPLTHSFCKHVVAAARPVVIEDSSRHPLVADNPARLEAQVAAYLGVPVISPNGHVLGSFCVMDNKPRRWTDAEIATMLDLAASVSSLVALQAERLERARTEEELQRVRLAREREQMLRMETAESLSRAKGDFLAAMSHELRTPMNGIIGMAEMLSQSDLSAEQKRMLCVIQDSGQSLLTVMDDILDFSRMEGGRFRLETIDFDLRAIVSGVVHASQAKAEQKGLALDTVFEGDGPMTVHGDAASVRQVLGNLVENAVKFTERGSVRVEVKVRREEAGTVLGRIEIIDTGIGIPPEAQGSLFQPFFQADTGDSRRFGGTGLGLAIARQLVRLMGGEIGVQSLASGGTCFWFQVPFQNELGQRRNTVAEQPKTAPLADSRAKTVLLVEDNVANQTLAQMMLERAGYQAHIASSGSEALEKLKCNSYHAVLMDCQMPGMDGFMTTRNIRAGSHGISDTKVWIIALTAYALPGDRERCLAAGMDDYISKPVMIDKLKEALGRVGTHVSREVSAPDPGPSQNWDDKVLLAFSSLKAPGGGSLSDHIAKLFLSETPARLSAIRCAIDTYNSKDSADLAHHLAGAAANVGALGLRTAALELEKAAQSGAWPTARAKLAHVISLWTLAKQRLAKPATA